VKKKRAKRWFFSGARLVDAADTPDADTCPDERPAARIDVLR